MSGGKAPKIPRHLQGEEINGKFAMLDVELFKCDGFQRLSHAGRAFYLLLAAWTETDEQRRLCHSVSREYADIGLLDITPEELACKVWGCKRPHLSAEWFVCPDSSFTGFGYSQQYLSKLRKELVEKGFIRVVCGGKGARCGWKRNVTLYSFSDRWRNAHNNS